jgi:FkbM family methyltransferase
MKHFIYKLFISIYNFLPGKHFLVKILKKIGLSKHKIYKDLKFKGEFRIEEMIQDTKIDFKMISYGGFIENETYWQGLFKSFEPESGKLWIDFVKVSANILDIGANTGIYSIAAKCVNPSINLYAFEPSKNTYSKFLENRKINQLDFQIFELALSDVNGKQLFYDMPSEVQTSASLSPDKSKNWDLFVGDLWEYEVETQTLDTFVHNQNIREIDLIKVDVEMHEPAVIRGYLQNLYIQLPVFFIEILTEKIALEIDAFMRKDYIYFQLFENGTMKEVENFEIIMGTWNYLLIPSVKIEKYQSILHKYLV